MLHSPQPENTMAALKDDAASEARPLLSTVEDYPARYTTPPKSPTSTDEEAGSTTSLLPSRSPDAYIHPEHSPLGRTVSWRSAYIIIISRVIGSGIFATPGTILRTVGSPGLALLLWVLGALVAACGLVVSLEYGCMLPRSGGYKVYLEFTYRHPRFLASTVVATHIVLLGFSASNCVVFSRYVLFALGVDGWASDFLRKSVGVGLLSVVTVIHGCLPRHGIRIQNWLGYVKVGIVAFMALSGLYVVAFPPTTYSGAQSQRELSSWEGMWEGSIWNWGTIAVAFFQITYSYAGLDNVNYILNEVKDPVRTLPSVASAALFTAGFLYTLINIAYFLVVPIQDIKDSGEMIAALFFERLFGEKLGRIGLPLAIALSAAGNVMVVVIAQVSDIRSSARAVHTFESLTTRIVSPQARDCPPRPPPLLGNPLVHPPIRFPTWWSPNPLHPLVTRNRLPAFGTGVHFHPLSRGLPGPVLLPGRWRGPHLAAIQEARSSSTVPGMDPSRDACLVSERIAARGAFLCPGGVPCLCGRGNKHVRWIKVPENPGTKTY